MIDEPDAFHEQPGRETPPYGRSYNPDYQARLKRRFSAIFATPVHTPKELAEQETDLVRFPPAYIEAECREIQKIQKTWSRRERVKRAGASARKLGSVLVPEVKFLEGFG